MELKKRIMLFVLILITGSSCIDLFSQKINSKPTRQSSLEAFSKGNYEQAYNEFSELLRIYSKDPLYNYYSGVCLVKLERNPGQASDLLKQAMQGAAVVRTLPPDATFYLGRALQMSGKFTEAIENYNLFTKQVGKKTAKESDVQEFVKQCNEKKGEITESGVIAAPEILPSEKVKSETVIKDTIPEVKAVVIQPIEKVESPEKNLPVSYEKLLDKALEFQFFADSLNSLVADQKKDLEKIPGNEKAALQSKISGNEQLAVSYQKSADQKYSEAQAAMNPATEETGKAELILVPDKKTVSDSVRQPDKKVVNETVVKPENKPAIDTVLKTADKPVKDTVQKPQPVTVKPVVKQSDTIKKVVPVINKPAGKLAMFEVIQKPGDPNKKIAVNAEVPEGLIYRIQLAVFHNPVTLAYFKGITPVYGFSIEGTDKTSYYGGMFRRISDAKAALAEVKARGFKDAFLVAFSGNKVISADRALQMEKEWNNKPLLRIDKTVSQVPADTIPPTLSFSVEVIRSLKPLKDDVAEGIKKLAGNRGLNVKQLEDGNTACYVGKFITFESATEYADLMKRNGYRDAHVVAFLGEKEVPVETARQLFENLK
jgi:hypothetical protein